VKRLLACEKRRYGERAAVRADGCRAIVRFGHGRSILATGAFYFLDSEALIARVL
jgi:hypothetical protein